MSQGRVIIATGALFVMYAAPGLQCTQQHSSEGGGQVQLVVQIATPAPCSPSTLTLW